MDPSKLKWAILIVTVVLLGLINLTNTIPCLTSKFVSRLTKVELEVDLQTHYAFKPTDETNLADLSENSKFIVAVSNGHQGTTFLSQSRNYRTDRLRLSSTSFFFEKASICVKNPCVNLVFDNCEYKHRDMALRYWYASLNDSSAELHEGERTLVNDVCMPQWDYGPSTLKVAVLGHDTVYYFQGFEDVLNNTFYVRLRRPRHETARSYAYGCKANEEKQFQKVGVANCVFLSSCTRARKEETYGYCPLERAEKVVLKIPIDVWTNFTYFQRALWFIDELEARWMRFVLAHPDLNFIDISWSSRQPELYGSMADAHANLAKVLGLKRSVLDKGINGHIPKGKHDVGPLPAVYGEQEQDYQSKMRFTQSQKNLIQLVQF